MENTEEKYKKINFDITYSCRLPRKLKKAVKAKRKVLSKVKVIMSVTKPILGL